MATVLSKTRKLFGELLRRKVIRLIGAYIAIFWLLATGLSDIVPALEFLPPWTFQAFVIVGIAIIPVLVFFSWKYDFVPPHLVKDPNDIDRLNPALAWATRRHDGKDAGYLLLKWSDEHGNDHEKLSFQPVSVGREPSNDVHLADNRVSRHHAVLWAQEGAWHVKDADSSNGTFIDTERVDKQSPLKPVCELRFHVNGPIVRVHAVKSDVTIAS